VGGGGQERDGMGWARRYVRWIASVNALDEDYRA
jgi:hypothetical protein